MWHFFAGWPPYRGVSWGILILANNCLLRVKSIYREHLSTYLQWNLLLLTLNTYLTYLTYLMQIQYCKLYISQGGSNCIKVEDWVLPIWALTLRLIHFWCFDTTKLYVSPHVFRSHCLMLPYIIEYSLLKVTR